jgi:hypothetical protein
VAAAIGKAQPNSCVNGDHRRRALPELGLGHGHRGRAAHPGAGTLRRYVRAGCLCNVQIEIMRQQERGRRAGPAEGLNPKTSRNLKEKLMTLIKKLSMATAVSTLLATGVFAQDNTGSSGQMMDGENGMAGNMMDGDMSGMDGMMPMMKMMQKMGPMMEACTEMMEAMNNSENETAPSTDKG